MSHCQWPANLVLSLTTLNNESASLTCAVAGGRIANQKKSLIAIRRIAAARLYTAGCMGGLADTCSRLVSGRGDRTIDLQGAVKSDLRAGDVYRCAQRQLNE